MTTKDRLIIIHEWVDDRVSALIIYELDYAQESINTRSLEKRVTQYKIPKQTFYRRLRRLQNDGWVKKSGKHRGRSPGVFVSLTNKASRKLAKLKDDKFENELAKFSKLLDAAPIDDVEKIDWIRRLLESFSIYMKRTSAQILLECIKDPTRKEMQFSFVRLWGGQNLLRVLKVLELLYEHRKLIINRLTIGPENTAKI